jgi:hypothetical protein
VGAVLAGAEDSDEALPSGGIRPTENFDDVDNLEALDPGRSGEGMLGAWP